METLNISTLTPGRRLARAVFSDEGKLLFPPGELITEERLRLLKEWGVGLVSVEEQSIPAPSPAPAPTPENIVDAAQQIVTDRFRYLNTAQEHTKVLFDLAVERQGRLLLSDPGRTKLGTNGSPAFQTQRPPKVSMKPLVESSQRMGTLPSIFHHLVELINSPYSDTKSVARVISLDPALAARLLKLVNSPFYGLPNKISTIPRAVAMVGTRQLLMLAMGATLVTAFKGVPVSLVNMQSFWAHSLSCGVSARQIARQIGLEQAESNFVSGLLHDIARLLVYTQLPGHALYILTEAKRQQQFVHSLEQETFGFTHEDLGAELLRSWRCPKDLINHVLGHHTPVSSSMNKEAVVLPAANTISLALGYGTSGEVYVPPLNPIAWSKLGLSPEQLLEHCTLLEEKVRQVRAFFDTTPIQ